MMSRRLAPARLLMAAKHLVRSTSTATTTAMCRPTTRTGTGSGPRLPQTAFPCLDQLDAKTEQLAAALATTSSTTGAAADTSTTSEGADSDSAGPEPSYATYKGMTGFRTWTLPRHSPPFQLDLGGTLPSVTMAYETWGTLNAARTNAILLHTGLSASSHARSHPQNPARGWWEDFIGPGLPLDTDRYFIICTNALGGCFGSTGPSSTDPVTGTPFATSFPLVTLWDTVRLQQLLVRDQFGIHKLHASVGASMGGMLAMAYAAAFPDQVSRLVSISACARAHPYSIALRFVQRAVMMADPAFATTRGNYYGGMPPHVGMKLARMIGTITYRSGPEWEKRFGRARPKGESPALCPDMLVERYLDHQGEKFSLSYDANSMLYLSKAMDLFDMSVGSKAELAARKRSPFDPPSLETDDNQASSDPLSAQEQLRLGMSELTMPSLVMGVTSDILFPLPQQAEIADTLKKVGNKAVTYYVLDAEYGHDTFLIDKVSVGAAVAGHLA
ncbi:Alpha/Beta hydrolase protein [Blastocladiella britannica]|nr:Alpha/Beta hydrolase protein [Blastocladiella britannica]